MEGGKFSLEWTINFPSKKILYNCDVPRFTAMFKYSFLSLYNITWFYKFWFLFLLFVAGWLLTCDDFTSTCRRVHVSVYDKNPEEHVRPAVVPDDVIASHSDKYWAPNPQTGVFGPETDHKPTAGTAAIGSIGEDSVLEQKAFFRPLEVEDLEKPPHPWVTLL